MAPLYVCGFWAGIQWHLCGFGCGYLAPLNWPDTGRFLYWQNFLLSVPGFYVSYEEFCPVQVERNVQLGVQLEQNTNICNTYFRPWFTTDLFCCILKNKQANKNLVCSVGALSWAQSSSPVL